MLDGGLGADQFIIQDESVKLSSLSGGAAPETDTVLDLNKSQGDIIALSDIDADITTDGNQAFHLVASLTGHAG